MNNTKIWPILATMLMLILLITQRAYATDIPDEYPDTAYYSGGVYIEAQTEERGKVIIYVPVDYKDGYFSFIKGTSTPVNMGNSTINCNLMYYANYWQCRITRMGTFEYYTQYSGTNWRWEPLTVTEIYNTNVQFIDNKSTTAIRQISPDTIIKYAMLAGVLLIIVLMITKRK